MSENYDGGIVQGYLREFLQLGIKKHNGEDVVLRLTELVDKADDHLDIWKVGNAADNKRRLIGQLKFQADLLKQSTPAQSQLLLDAAEALARRSK